MAAFIQKCFIWLLAIVSFSAVANAQTNAGVSSAATQATPSRDGQHDFDFEVGTWKIHLKRLLHPLTGSNTWVEFDGSTFTQKVWSGRANVEQFETNSSSGHIEGMTLRLYNPSSHQWSLYWATSENGALGIPTVGEFTNGVGQFYDQEPINGKMTLVRFIWSQITPNSAHFEQSFSVDGGQTWEVNWITDQTRISEEEFKTLAAATTPKFDLSPGNAHDFDFETGSWNCHLKRLLRPLTGSNTWVDYEGTSVVKDIWNGRANFGELEVGDSAVHIEGLTLRLYNPRAHQWRLYWANSKDGILSGSTVGQFTNGRGEFFDQEDYNEKSIFVRFVFSDVAHDSFKTEQAFSPDFGKTWEPNWIATFTRQKK